MIVFLIFFISCDGGEMSEKNVSFSSLKEVPASAWKKLAQKKIYFGHQSVGYNIIDGIRDIMKENQQIKLNIVETADESDFKWGVFAHSPIGENENPKTKIEQFEKLMEEGIGNKANLAFFKFCYVDIVSETDINTLFYDYKQTIERLKTKFPQTIFIHVTSPLMIVQSGPKAWIKKIIGRPIGGYDDNIIRNQYNELLNKEYNSKEPIFDIAKIESTLPDGTMLTFKKDEKHYFTVVPEYTYDGRHLNETGRRKVAERLLLYLTELTK